MSLDYPYACEGECDEHSGNVRRVHVRDPINKFDWGFFRYCDIAVQDDMRMGFEVKDAPANQIQEKAP